MYAANIWMKSHDSVFKYLIDNCKSPVKLLQGRCIGTVGRKKIGQLLIPEEVRELLIYSFSYHSFSFDIVLFIYHIIHMGNNKANYPISDRS